MRCAEANDRERPEDCAKPGGGLEQSESDLSDVENVFSEERQQDLVRAPEQGGEEREADHGDEQAVPEDIARTLEQWIPLGAASRGGARCGTQGDRQHPGDGVAGGRDEECLAAAEDGDDDAGGRWSDHPHAVPDRAIQRHRAGDHSHVDELRQDRVLRGRHQRIQGAAGERPEDDHPQLDDTRDHRERQPEVQRRAEERTADQQSPVVQSIGEMTERDNEDDGRDRGTQHDDADSRRRLIQLDGNEPERADDAELDREHPHERCHPVEAIVRVAERAPTRELILGGRGFCFCGHPGQSSDQAPV